MNQYTKLSVLIILSIGAFQIHAYTFTVQNLTKNKHEVALKLTGFTEKPTPYQTVEAYSVSKNPLIPLYEELKDRWTKEVSKIINTLLLEHKKLNKSAFIQSTANLKADIDKTIKTSLPEWAATTKTWTDKLTKLEDTINKTDKPSSSDIEEWERKLGSFKNTISETFQFNINSNGMTVKPENYATFKFGGLRSGFCVGKAFADGKECPIYGIPNQHYHSVIEKVLTGNTNIDKEFFWRTNLSKSLLGKCGDSDFKLIEHNNDLIFVVLIVPVSL